jgi:hypothetical protein
MQDERSAFLGSKPLVTSLLTCTVPDVALQLLQAAHIRVVCDACRTASAEICGKRDLPIAARVAAMRKFLAVGWHHDPGIDRRTRVLEQAARDGTGRWYCPSCSRKTHL